MSKEVNIIKSGTWMGDGLTEQNEILNEAIESFVDDNERIINIQMEDDFGIKRFWIYTINN